MKKKSKKMIAAFLTAAMAMSVGMPAFAAEENGNEDEKKEIVAIVVENGVATSYTADEYDNYLKENGRNITVRELQNNIFSDNNEEKNIKLPEQKIESMNNPNTDSPNVSVTRNYRETSGTDNIYYYLEQPVTPITNGGEMGATISYGESVTISESLSGSASLSLGQKNVVLAQLGGSYSMTASTLSRFTTTFTIPPYKRARVYFAPNLRYTRGVLTERTDYNGGDSTTTTIDVYGYVPKKIGAFADGEYYLKYV